MMKASTVRARNVDGTISGVADSRMCTRPASMSMPQEMVGAFSPMPRKLSVASAAMNDPSAMVSTTMAGASAFGRMCRHMIRPLPAPSIRAAAT